MIAIKLRPLYVVVKAEVMEFANHVQHVNFRRTVDFAGSFV